MLKIIELFNNNPVCVQIDTGAIFQPGHIGSLKINRGQSVLDICDGLHPIGIIDDIKSNIIRHIPSPPKQVVIVSNTYMEQKGKNYVLSQDHKVELSHTNIISASFSSDVNVALDAVKGVITFIAGTICNYPMPNSRDGILNAIRMESTYAYNTTCDHFEDSTSGSQRATIWTQNMIAETDMYDTTQNYDQSYANLYVEHGLLTTRRASPYCKCAGFVISPPNDTGLLRFFWDPKNNVETNSSLDSHKIA